MSTAAELIEIIESTGGRFMIDGDRLGIVLKDAAESLVAELRTNKTAIIQLLKTRDEKNVDQDPAEWRKDLRRWVVQNCVHRSGMWDSSATEYLWCDYCSWSFAIDLVPCKKNTFEHLLTVAGFPVRNGVVGGLLLRVDWEAHLRFPVDMAAEPDEPR